MKKILFVILLVTSTISISLAQDIIKGLTISISLVPKSAKQPNLKLKDGSGVFLVYKAESGINVIMGKNGKQFPICDPMENTKFVQVGEIDLEKDGKPEIVVASKTSAETIEVRIFKKEEFEVYYKEWSSFTGVASVEFPGNGTVKLYDKEGNAGSYTFNAEGQLAEAK